MTQAEIDSFILSYPGCTNLNGHLTIGPSSDIVNLNGLSNIEYVPGGLGVINNTLLEDGSGLSNLTFIGASININNNPNLKGLDLGDVASMSMHYFYVGNNAGLLSMIAPRHIQSLSNNLIITNNPSLTLLEGFDNLTYIEGQLHIAGTAASSFPTFNDLIYVGGTIYIFDNDRLLDLDLQSIDSINLQGIQIVDNDSLINFFGPQHLTSTNGSISIARNPVLANMTGFDELSHIGGGFQISNTIAQGFPPFQHLEFIGHSINISDNSQLESLDLSNVGSANMTYLGIFGNGSLSHFAAPKYIPSISGNLSIQFNPNLTTMTGFDSLGFIGDQLHVRQTKIVDFPVFSSLESVNSLHLIGNIGVQNLDWLPNLATIEYLLSIVGNPELGSCSIAAICNFLPSSGPRTIYSNKSCCQNELILTNACNNISNAGAEICDGIDNNCNGIIDEDFDQDDDGYTTCQGDCDDTNADVNPDAEEVCDGIDNDCDGEVDENFDQDNDGIVDCTDNCPDSPNADQIDSDCDGVGDVCDEWPGCDDTIDSDEDGIPNCVDLDELTNWTCGNNGNKVEICHIPAGNPENRHVMCINQNAVGNHLASHGDYIGECDQVFCNGESFLISTGSLLVSGLKNKKLYGFTIYPNPTHGVLTLGLENYLHNEISITISDYLGREVFFLPIQEVSHPIQHIDLLKQSLKEGVYSLAIKSKEGQQVRQFILAK